jgi:predicted DNA-binding transcriptional regulator AlpA
VDERLMNKAEFAKRVGISVPTLDRLMKKGLVEHTRPSPFRVYFTEA